MKIFKYYIFSFLAIFALFINAQAIDPSLLENLTPEQIKIAQAELKKTKPKSEPKPEITESTIKKPNSDIIKDDNVNKDNNVKYGYSFFSSIPTTISAVGDLPIPNDYKISLNDQLTIILSGSKELKVLNCCVICPFFPKNSVLMFCRSSLFFTVSIFALKIEFILSKSLIR